MVSKKLHTCKSMFIAAVFTAARRWNQLRLPSVDDWKWKCGPCNFFLVTPISFTVMTVATEMSLYLRALSYFCGGTRFGSENPYQATHNCRYFQPQGIRLRPPLGDFVGTRHAHGSQTYTMALTQNETNSQCVCSSLSPGTLNASMLLSWPMHNLQALSV